MSRPDPVYYLARGRSLDAVRDYLAKREVYQQAVIDLGMELGVLKITNRASDGKRESSGWFESHGKLYGYQWPVNTNPPEGWRREKGMRGQCIVPAMKSKTGKAANARIRELPPLPDTGQLTVALCGSPFPWMGPAQFSTGHEMATYAIEELAGEIVLSIPEGGKAPYDAEPLSRPVYWQMREDDDAKRAKATEASEPAQAVAP